MAGRHITGCLNIMSVCVGIYIYNFDQLHKVVDVMVHNIYVEKYIKRSGGNKDDAVVYNFLFLLFLIARADSTPIFCAVVLSTFCIYIFFYKPLPLVAYIICVSEIYIYIYICE